jgi:hypothetical protein
MREILLESFLDTLKMLPFLFGAYLLIEWIAHRAEDAFKDRLRRFGMFGSVGGTALGLVPQCGFSVAAANFYADRIITPGTLLAVFIATSDEAVPVLLAKQGTLPLILPLICVKVVLAIIVGLAVDFGFRRLWKPVWEAHTELRHHHGCHHPKEESEDERECRHEHCQGGVWRVALIRSLEVSALIFVVTVLLNIGLDALGEERTAAFLMTGNRLQPVAAALFGLIPSCASSVFLTQMYAEGSLSFGAVVAGLSSSAGVGILILCQAVRRRCEACLILAFLFAVSAVAGLIIDLAVG